MKISVVIVNWNTKSLLQKCLDSISIELKDIDNEIIVVDNASTDGTQDMVRRGFPEVRLIENKENVGFPRANNQVLLQCQGEYLMFLNPDTFVLPGAIRKMMQFLDINKEYGAVGPKIIRPDNSIQMECACNLPSLWGVFCELTWLSRIFSKSSLFGRWRMTWWDHQDSRDVQCLLGAAILMRRTILNKIGLLVEHMYIEDDDLCFRILKAGWKIHYLSTVQIVHHDGASRKRSRQFYHHYQIAWNGLWYFFIKNKGGLHAWIFRLMTLICSMVGMPFFFLAALVLFFNKNLSDIFRVKGRKAWAVFLWSITPYKYFKSSY